MIFRQPGQTALAPPGLVTTTSQTRDLRGPLLPEIVAVNVVAVAAVTLALGVGPDPFWNVTVAPAAKPVPVIVPQTPPGRAPPPDP